MVWHYFDGNLLTGASDAGSIKNSDFLSFCLGNDMRYSRSYNGILTETYRCPT